MKWNLHVKNVALERIVFKHVYGPFWADTNTHAVYRGPRHNLFQQRLKSGRSIIFGSRYFESSVQIPLTDEILFLDYKPVDLQTQRFARSYRPTV